MGEKPLNDDRLLASELSMVISGYEQTLATALGGEEASQQIDEGIHTARKRAQTVEEIALRIVRNPIFERLVRKIFKSETAELTTLVQQLTEKQHQRIVERASRIAEWCLGRLKPAARLDVDIQAVREWRKQVGGHFRLQLIDLIDEQWPAFQAWNRRIDILSTAAEHWKARKGQLHEKLFAVDRMTSEHTGLPVRPRTQPPAPDDLAPPKILCFPSPPSEMVSEERATHDQQSTDSGGEAESTEEETEII